MNQTQPQDTFFHSRLFKGLTSAELARVTEICKRKQLKAGSYLFRQHSSADQVYTLISGALMIERTSKAGRRQVIAFSYPGDYIGFTNTNEFEYSVLCLRDANLQCYSRHQFLELVDSIPTLKVNARNMGGSVLAHTLDQLFALGQKKAHERVCFLLREIQMRQTGTQKPTIELIMNRQEIADYLGLTIETVSRAFSKLKNDQIIRIHSPHQVEVLDAEQLEALASPH